MQIRFLCFFILSVKSIHNNYQMGTRLLFYDMLMKLFVDIVVQLLAGCPDNKLEAYKLHRDPAKFHYLNQGGSPKVNFGCGLLGNFIHYDFKRWIALHYKTFQESMAFIN